MKTLKENLKNNASFQELLKEEKVNVTKKVTILLVCAMTEELDGLIMVLKENNIAYETLESTNHGFIYKFNVNNYEIYGTSLGITYFNMFNIYDMLPFKPDMVINFGTCASISDLKRGEVVVSNNCYCFDLDLTVFGYLDGEVIHTLDKRIGPKIVSGSSFLDSPEQHAKLKERFGDAVTYDMESFALKKLCHTLNLPFLSIRAISDFGDEEIGASFDQIAAEYAAISVAYVLEFLKRKDVLKLF